MFKNSTYIIYFAKVYLNTIYLTLCGLEADYEVSTMFVLLD